jgi:hypothetical protein
MLKRLQLKINEQALINLQTWMMDSTAVQATRDSSCNRDKREPADHALARISHDRINKNG